MIKKANTDYPMIKLIINKANADFRPTNKDYGLGNTITSSKMYNIYVAQSAEILHIIYDNSVIFVVSR